MVVQEVVGLCLTWLTIDGFSLRISYYFCYVSYERLLLLVLKMYPIIPVCIRIIFIFLLLGRDYFYWCLGC